MEHITIEECCDILDSRRIPITASERRNGRYPYYGANGIQDYVADYIFDDELVLLAKMVETSVQKHAQLLIEFLENVG